MIKLNFWELFEQNYMYFRRININFYHLTNNIKALDDRKPVEHPLKCTYDVYVDVLTDS